MVPCNSTPGLNWHALKCPGFFFLECEACKLSWTSVVALLVL